MAIDAREKTAAAASVATNRCGLNFRWLEFVDSGNLSWRQFEILQCFGGELPRLTSRKWCQAHVFCLP